MIYIYIGHARPNAAAGPNAERGDPGSFGHWKQGEKRVYGLARPRALEIRFGWVGWCVSHAAVNARLKQLQSRWNGEAYTGPSSDAA